jgi:hypothetical protein
MNNNMITINVVRRDEGHYHVTVFRSNGQMYAVNARQLGDEWSVDGFLSEKQAALVIQAVENYEA